MLHIIPGFPFKHRCHSLLMLMLLSRVFLLLFHLPHFTKHTNSLLASATQVRRYIGRLLITSIITDDGKPYRSNTCLLVFHRGETYRRSMNPSNFSANSTSVSSAVLSLAIAVMHVRIFSVRSGTGTGSIDDDITRNGLCINIFLNLKSRSKLKQRSNTDDKTIHNMFTYWRIIIWLLLEMSKRVFNVNQNENHK